MEISVDLTRCQTTDAEYLDEHTQKCLTIIWSIQPPRVRCLPNEPVVPLPSGTDLLTR